ncbi:MAG: hypothetical protein AAGJ83_12530 [Planctomycetota bacterium]
MNRIQFFTILAAMTLWMNLNLHSTAHAGLVVEFGRSEYFVAPGSTVSVDVFLTETSTTSILSTEGLFSFGFEIAFESEVGYNDPAFVQSLSDIKKNDLFDAIPGIGEETTLSPGVSVGYADAVFFNDAPIGSSILLGSVNFTAGDTANQITKLTLNDFSAMTDFVAGNGNGLDGDISLGAGARITTIPEPTSGILMAVIAIAACCRRRTSNRRWQV